MSFQEKMMENMLGKMSSEEKKTMMDKMMDGFFSTMTKEEKQEMMNKMMPKMMGSQHSSESGGFSMIDMMSSMMGGSKTSGFNPMDMCKNMMSTISKSSEIATFATPEVRQLFEEWVQQVDEEILNYIKENNSADPDQIAKHLKISRNSVIYFLSRLAQNGKLSIRIESSGNKE